MLSEKDLFKLNTHSSKHASSSKTLYKFWSGLTKLLRFHYSAKNSVNYDPLGTFHSIPASFSPSSAFLNSLGYSTSTLPFPSLVQLTDTQLSSVCSIDSSVIKACSKEIFTRCLAQINQGFQVRLDLKIGQLHLSKSSFKFAPKWNFLEKYHASNPNPVNHDSSSNEIKPHKRTELSFISRLPPLILQNHSKMIIINRHCKRQHIEPYLSAKELIMQNSRSKSGQKVGKLRKIEDYELKQLSLERINQSDDLRRVERLSEIQEASKLNYSMAEDNKSKKLKEFLISRKERYDYFPFTEGESVEAHRTNLNRQRYSEYLNSVSQPPSTPSPFKHAPSYHEGSISCKDRSLNKLLTSKLNR